LDQVYAANLGEEVEHVTVEFTGSVGGTAWLALAELELLQEAGDTIEGVNIATSAAITSSPTKDAPENAGALVDGKATAWVSRDGATPAWFQLDYAKAREVDSIRLKFEEGQPDRSMQFTLKVIDANGDEHTVAERTEADLSKQQGIVMDVPVGMSITRIRMDIADARIPSSGSPAWPLVSEIEVYATPGNVARDAKTTASDGSTLTAADLAKLTDGDRDSAATLTATADKTLTFTLAKAADINMLGLLASGNSEPVRFKAEYRVVPQDGGGAGDGAADQWKTLTDYSGNAQMKPEIVARLARPVYTDAVRITVLNENPVAINELYLYQADAGASLESYLSSVETALGKLTVGEYAGNVTRAAKTKLEVVLERARAALDAGLTSREAGRWTTTVEDAVSEFY
ncbi:discoidin domain-containing protein, partial [Bifidobacterium bifidum]